MLQRDSFSLWQDIWIRTQPVVSNALEEVMSVILTLITLAILILLGMARKERPVSQENGVIVKRFLHPGHSWIRLTGDGEAFVGIDAFAQSVIGRIDEVRLPRLLHFVKQGEPVIRVRHGERMLSLVSPISGRVIERNEMVLRSAERINSSPYGEGWLFKVHPRALEPQLRNLLRGKWARAWQDVSMAQLGRAFSATSELRFQDGGTIVPDLADKSTPEQWNTIATEFFFVDELAGKGKE